MGRFWLVIAGMCAALSILAPVAAADGALPEQTIVLGGTLVDHNPFAPGSRRGSVPVTIFLERERLRVDFTGPAGQRGMLLHDVAAGQGWLADLDARMAIPVDAGATRSFSGLVVDPEAPCRRIGPRCEPASARFIAGESRRGYRFRSAEGKGPGGLSDGVFWIDASLGVVLAYRAAGARPERGPALEADFALIDELPDSYFELPDLDVPEHAPPGS